MPFNRIRRYEARNRIAGVQAHTYGEHGSFEARLRRIFPELSDEERFAIQLTAYENPALMSVIREWHTRKRQSQAEVLVSRCRSPHMNPHHPSLLCNIVDGASQFGSTVRGPLRRQFLAEIGTTENELQEFRNRKPISTALYTIRHAIQSTLRRSSTRWPG